MKLADIFQNGAVLQRHKKIKIWGYDDQGKHVKVVLSTKPEIEAEADVVDGRFMVEIPPLEAQNNISMIVVNDQGEKLSLQDLAIGEVWIAGGQSNMEFCMKWDAEREDFVSSYENSKIRFFEVPKISYEGALKEENHSTEGVWRKAGPGQTEYFSAVGFYFALALQKNLDGVTIGIVGCNWGGTSASCWMPEEDLVSDFPIYLELKKKAEKTDLEKYFEIFKNRRRAELSEAERKKLDLLMKTPNTEPQPTMEPSPEMEEFMVYKYAPFSAFSPGVLYQTMLKNIIPYTCKGVIWYQGEEDSLPEYGGNYSKLFEKMIRRWRKDWQEKLPFLFVQLAGYTNPGGQLQLDFTEVRAEQELVSKKVEECWMAVVYDQGLQYDIHPKRKRPVGERLAAQALHHVYGQDQISESPDILYMQKKDGKVVLGILYAGKGLYLANSDVEIKGLELFVNGEKQKKFTTVMQKDQLCIYCDMIQKDSRITLRYAWKDWTETNVYGESGLPLRPFRVEL